MHTQVSHNNIGYHTLALPSICLLASLVSCSCLFPTLLFVSPSVSHPSPLSSPLTSLSPHPVFYIILHFYTLPLCILTLVKGSLLLSLLLSLSLSISNISLSLSTPLSLSLSLFVSHCLYLYLPPSLPLHPYFFSHS